jgi:phosphatidylserine decarboxylase
MLFLIHSIHPEGWRFVSIFAAVSLIFFQFSETLGWCTGILTAWCFYFFRNPKRVVPQDKGLIVSPADGKVVGVHQVPPPEALDMGTDPRTRISIFLNVFDVHVNRVPASGTVRKVLYHEGQFLNASFDKASDLNERNTVVISLDDDPKKDMAFVQIAGLIARRIRCDIDEGDLVSKGHVYGLIRFGSRMDIYLPKGVHARVAVGQRTIAGETVLGDMVNNSDAPTGRSI